MAKKSKGLTEDELKWILSVDATDAQQAIHKTDKESKQLVATNKELKKAMLELIAAGKKESDEYKNLSTEVDHNNAKLNINKEKVKELEKTLGLTSLTMTQLRKKAKDLQYQLDHTSDALNPEEYAKINQELLSTKARMEELRNSGNKTNSTLNDQSVSVSRLTTLFKAFMALKVVQYLKDLFLQSYNTRKEFARYEAVLTNTFQSQEKATKAMSMLKKTAADTPYQLQELTESYVRLVNRGIIPTQNELIKLGDLSASQGKSLDQLVEAILDAQTGEFERLKEFGIKASKSGDVVKFTFKGISTSVKYTEKAISEYIYSLGELKGVQGGMAMQMEQLEGKASNFGDTMDALYNKIGTKLEPAIKSFFSIASHSVQQLSDSMKPLNESFDEQMEKVVSLEQNLPPLLQRYQELKTKTTLSKEEHAELNKIIGNLGSIVPGAITAWDQYGNAIDINTDKVYQFLEAQQNSLKYEHKDLIKETEQNIKTFKLQKEMLEKEMAQGGEYKAGKYGDYLFEPYSPEVIAIKVKQINDFGKNIQGAEEYLKKINGESLRNQIEGQKETIKKRNEFNGMTKEQLSEYIKINKDASDEYIAIAEDIYNEKFKEKNTPTDNKKIKTALDLKLKEQENAHADELVLLKKNKLEFSQTEHYYNLEVLNSDSAYYNKRIKQLEEYQKKTSDPKILAEINKQIISSQTALLDIQQKREKETLSAIKDNRDKQLKVEQDTYTGQKTILEKALTTKKITQDQYNMLVLNLDTESADSRLKIQQQYAEDVSSLEIQSGTLKADSIQEANQAVLNADLQAAQSRAQQQKSLQNLVKDFKGEFKLTTVGEDTDLQLKVLEASYQARKEMALKKNWDTIELDKAYEKARTNILQEGEDKRNQVRSQYGLLSLQEQYEIEQEQLKKQRDEGIISEEEYQKALVNKKISTLKTYYDYYKQLVTGALSALEEAELANIDAKYDVEIERAQGNADEVARLEKEKEQKKLEVQKKYAGVNFAIKVSQIIADTAVSIMKAYADLGPIGGSIAAALLAVTGVAQVAAANAERKKVMNMTVGGGSSGSGSGQRVVTGKESGGYIRISRAQDGKEFDATLSPNQRGYINRPTVIVGEGPNSQEWVASNAALKNPTVAPIIQLMNQSQEAGTIRTIDMNQLMRQRLAGFSSGGFIASSSVTPLLASSTHLPPIYPEGIGPVLNDLMLIFSEIKKNGIKAKIVYSEFQKLESEYNKSLSIGSKS